MKALFFLIVIINVGLLMWEYHQGAFRVTEAELVNKEPMLLTSELKKISPEHVTEIELSANVDTPTTEQLSAEQQQKPSESTTNEQSLSRQDELNARSTEAQESEQLSAEQQQKPSESITNEQTLPSQDELKAQATESAASPAMVCYEAGPFADTKAFNAWHSLLKDTADDDIKAFDREEPVISSYMVFYPAEKTIEQAEVAVKMLKDQGIKDLLLQRAGKDRGEISLGVFNSEARALVLKNQLQAKGISVDIKPRYKTMTGKYVHVSGHAAVLESLQKIQNRNPKFTIKPVDSCP